LSLKLTCKTSYEDNIPIFEVLLEISELSEIQLELSQDVQATFANIDGHIMPISLPTTATRFPPDATANFTIGDDKLIDPKVINWEKVAFSILLSWLERMNPKSTDVPIIVFRLTEESLHQNEASTADCFSLAFCEILWFAK
jgi:hypothetical protein